jgi:NADPH-dependent glutamate synthase beta subunit-like oxidoreductase/glutamate synthase domain-containing protein 3/NAD-dependent dihydropyrimidine dehydrogenase PreA subunit
MSGRHYYVISGKKEGKRLDSCVLEEMIQRAVARGYRDLYIQAFGQHGIGGRLWKAGDNSVYIKIEGQPGQRVGSMGFPNTRIEIMGPSSDDVGWLNAGAEIVVHGHAGNGVANAMGQGKVMVAGNIGARGMTMTKHNPRFDPPQLWVLGSVGDYFGEFMAGGIAVICGVEPQNASNVLGHRPLVGMVSGQVFFRGSQDGYSQVDAKAVPISNETWAWLEKNLRAFLDRINRPELFETLADSSQWHLLQARTPQEKAGRQLRPMHVFRSEVWDRQLGPGGLIGDLTSLERDPIALIPTGALRRFVPVWENRIWAAPCEATCPTGIPIQERWRLIREGRVDEAVDLALAYTPFPASVCGYLCPNLCMQACSRQSAAMIPVDVSQLGRASIAAALPEMPPPSGKKVAVVGGGPAGISVAWQLRRRGHRPTIFDTAAALGGKLLSVIPSSRIPAEVVDQELQRAAKVIKHVHLPQPLEREAFERLKQENDFIVIAAGARQAIMPTVAGRERLVPALEFLAQAKRGKAAPGRRVVIIGAGNVGCDAAAEAHRLGAEEITLLDIQRPASFGKERATAEAVGAKFIWPRTVEEISADGVRLAEGETIAADTVIAAIGERPLLDFLPPELVNTSGFVPVDANGQTSDGKIFAIGDAVKPGLLTDAIGSGRIAAEAIDALAAGREPGAQRRPMIDRERVSLAYFDPRVTQFDDTSHCGSQCASCGTCRDCGICVQICPQRAISREALPDDEFAYVVDETRCIGCGFCAGACPCGIWNLVANEPLA